MNEDEKSSFAQDLEKAFPRPPVEPGKVGLRPTALTSEQDSQLAIIQITQYAMYVVFQLLVLALTAAVTASLIISIWRLTAHPATTQLILSAVAAPGRDCHRRGPRSSSRSRPAMPRSAGWKCRQHRGETMT